MRITLTGREIEHAIANHLNGATIKPAGLAGSIRVSSRTLLQHVGPMHGGDVIDLTGAFYSIEFEVVSDG